MEGPGFLELARSFHERQALWSPSRLPSGATLLWWEGGGFWLQEPECLGPAASQLPHVSLGGAPCEVPPCWVLPRTCDPTLKPNAALGGNTWQVSTKAGWCAQMACPTDPPSWTSGLWVNSASSLVWGKQDQMETCQPGDP